MDTATFDFLDKNSFAAAALSNKNDLKVSFLENGSIFSISKGNILINQLMASPVESALSNIYVRTFGKSIGYFPIMGPRSHATHALLLYDERVFRPFDKENTVVSYRPAPQMAKRSQQDSPQR